MECSCPEQCRAPRDCRGVEVGDRTAIDCRLVGVGGEVLYDRGTGVMRGVVSSGGVGGDGGDMGGARVIHYYDTATPFS